MTHNNKNQCPPTFDGYVNCHETERHKTTWILQRHQGKGIRCDTTQSNTVSVYKGGRLVTGGETVSGQGAG